MADRQDVAVGVGVGATLALITAEAWQRMLAKEIADQKPARLQKVDPRSIKADPETFQFKSGGDAHGVTDRLKGVTQWDPVAAGKTVVWERADGARFIADGHQRRGLALRSIEAGQKNVRLDAYVMREREGWKPRASALTTSASPAARMPPMAETRRKVRSDRP